MKAKCKKCGDTVEVTKPREYKTCKCGAIGLDYGDEYYYRVCGDPEDFDGEVEGVPDNLMHDNHRDLSHEAAVVDNFWVEVAEHFKAIAKLCEERSKNGK